MPTLIVTLLPGVLLGDHVVFTVVCPEGAPHSNGVTIFEMSVDVQV
jgi:hypothetical protein